MPDMYFKHTVTEKMFKVIDTREDGSNTYITLECKDGTFEELYTKQRFKDMGYKLVKIDNEDDDGSED